MRVAQTLRVLSDDGFVERNVLPSSPPGVEYALTRRGGDLVQHLVPLMEWIAEHAPDIVGS